MRSSPSPPASPTAVTTGGGADPQSTASVDFVNTIACEACRSSDGLASAETFGRWNRLHPGLPSLSPSREILDELRALRHDLHDIFERQTQGRSPGPALLRRLNRWFGASPAYLRVGFVSGRWRLEEVPRGIRPSQRWESEMARAAVSLLAGPWAPKLRRCQAPGCVHFLVSRRQDQLWCSPTGCGNRVRVARHYRRWKRKSERSARSRKAPRTLRAIGRGGM